MEMLSIEKELQENSYPGRGIIIGRSADGAKAVAAYFIMGEVRTVGTVSLWRTERGSVPRPLTSQS